MDIPLFRMYFIIVLIFKPVIADDEKACISFYQKGSRGYEKECFAFSGCNCSDTNNSTTVFYFANTSECNVKLGLIHISLLFEGILIIILLFIVNIIRRKINGIHPGPVEFNGSGVRDKRLARSVSKTTQTHTGSLERSHVQSNASYEFYEVFDQGRWTHSKTIVLPETE